jgi:hypothetical protein
VLACFFSFFLYCNGEWERAVYTLSCDFLRFWDSEMEANGDLDAMDVLKTRPLLSVTGASGEGEWELPPVLAAKLLAASLVIDDCLYALANLSRVLYGIRLTGKEAP